MASNDFKADTAIRAQIFEEIAWQEQLPDSFWQRWVKWTNPGDNTHMTIPSSIVTSDSESPVVMKRDFMGKKGDKLNFTLVLALTGTGTTGSSGKRIKDNAEAIVTYADDLTLEQYRHAVSDISGLGRQRVMIDVPDNIRKALSSWGVEKLDKLCFEEIEASPTTILYGGDATATTDISTAATATMSIFQKAKIIANTRNSGSRYRIPPIMINGKAHWVAVAHPNVQYDLQRDTEYMSALQYAAVKGTDNPLFAGADLITVDGIIIYFNEMAGTTLTWGSGANVPGANITLFGKKALMIGMGAAPTILSELEDFDNEISYGYKGLFKVEKPVFNSKDFGSLQIRVATTNAAAIS